MTGSRHATALVIGIFALLLGGAAQAQDDLSAGKTPGQLFRLDCAICHKSARGLSKADVGGLFGLEGFLAQHYTASGETATAIARYLKSVDTAATPRRARHPHRDAARPHKPAAAAAKADTAKKTDTAKKSDEADKTTTGSVKTDEPKAGAAEASEEKPSAPKVNKNEVDKNKVDEKTPAPHNEAKRAKPEARKKTD